MVGEQLLSLAKAAMTMLPVRPGGDVIETLYGVGYCFKEAGPI
jgi:hypothetical protein